MAMGDPMPRRGTGPTPKATGGAPSTSKGHMLTARPDTVDFRDLMYVPTLVEVQDAIPLEQFLAAEVPVIDQGTEGACTGFGLATVIHYLLRTKEVTADPSEVSPWMLYEMARRYDEWPGEQYVGSSARGAMKGWHKHGVCSEGQWKPCADSSMDGGLTPVRAADARQRPLGAYFRVNHKDLVAMHAAITETKILYASATVHEGWEKVQSDGTIPYESKVLGGHAFAIVAYDKEGFWIQNSWGRGWGKNGFAKITYADWLANGADVWVARMGARIQLDAGPGFELARSNFMSETTGKSHADVRPHIVSVGNNGQLRDWGPYATSRADVEHILVHEIPDSGARRILLYAHGGLVSEQNAVQRVGEYLPALTGAKIYPLAFVWKSDLWSTLTNILKDAIRQRRTEGVLDAAKDFMLDRLDDALEPVARLVGGRGIWEEMKENAVLSTEAIDGAARAVAEGVAALADGGQYEIHVIGHSAGSIFLGPVVELLTTRKGQAIRRGDRTIGEGLGQTISSCTMWAPACTTQFFKDHYLPGIRSEAIERFRLFTLTDEAERDDHCSGIYHKSLLYLVSHALERTPRVPFIHPNGTPLLGLERDVRDDDELRAVFENQDPASALGGAVSWVRAPNRANPKEGAGSRSSHHGDFDDDDATVKAALSVMLGSELAVPATVAFSRSVASNRDRRQSIDAMTRSADFAGRP